jgi:ribosome biogenesis GTPase
MNSVSQVHQFFDGTVYKKTTGSYTVHTGSRTVPCSISTRLRRELIYPTADPNSLRQVVVGVREIQAVDPVAVGDRVRCVDAGDGSGMIMEVLPRRSRLARRSAVPMPGAHAFEQVIVANVDQVVPVFAAANPAPKWNLLDRYLVSAESLELPALIVITKMDLADPGDGLDAALEEYRRIGYPVVLTCAQTGEGIDALKGALDGRLSVFIGKSGVGKTSLLNAIQPGLGLRVNQVSEKTGKGKHTTTHLEMVPVNEATFVVDTPGMREFGLWDVDEADLAMFFPEMRPYIGACRFGLGCSHVQEQGCKVRMAVQTGEISAQRYESFLRLLEG